ncbi:uncharacterized protein Tco025E_02019 [Trypanosoma conorhini]|uniref:Uncharacterized protein n=1 Tax=Trypanosoma conorhini TaxID=83891 RepID=A0A3R7NR03_9TRYP|nr:uncharacterized protein Tco025E_02019 [Trypanosoma conorhini]RNF25720.1 hypothetical protein Tco025E_02019 [Trypanosoma conorhini]
MEVLQAPINPAPAPPSAGSKCIAPPPLEITSAGLCAEAPYAHVACVRSPPQDSFRGGSWPPTPKRQQAQFPDAPHLLDYRAADETAEGSRRVHQEDLQDKRNESHSCLQTHPWCAFPRTASDRRFSPAFAQPHAPPAHGRVCRQRRGSGWRSRRSDRSPPLPPSDLWRRSCPSLQARCGKHATPCGRNRPQYSRDSRRRAILRQKVMTRKNIFPSHACRMHHAGAVCPASSADFMQ